MTVTVHASPHIGWHADFANKCSEGLRNLGVQFNVTSSRGRVDDGLAILLGTSAFRAVEATGPYLRARGWPRLPSIDSINAVSSPQI